VSILLVGSAVFVVGRGFVEPGAAHAAAVVGADPQFSRAMLAQRWQSTSIVLGKGLVVIVCCVHDHQYQPQANRGISCQRTANYEL